MEDPDKMNRTGKIRKRLFTVLLAAAMSLGAFFQAGASDDGVHLEKVHTIYWNAKLKKSLKSGKETLVKSGTSVIVTKRNYKRGISQIMYGDGKLADVKNSWLSYKSDYTTIQSEGDYNIATKEAFINGSTSVKAKEKYLVWISLDKQRVNVFIPSGNVWKLHRVFRCSSGKAKSPTKIGWKKVDYKRSRFRGLRWYTEVAGGGMHRWPGKIKIATLGNHVASHGCIRLSEKDAHEIYSMIPLKTRVLVY
jgi:lipoprotein-anchoring transpeptidase ErfK/SrfK